MSNLITVPSFTFQQGFDDGWPATTVSYWDKGNTIALQQCDDEEIVISFQYLDKLIKEIKKHRPAAAKALADE